MLNKWFWSNTIIGQLNQKHYMNLQTDPLDNQPRTHWIPRDWEISIELYLNWQFGCIGDPDRQFGNGFVRTATLTWSDSPGQLLTPQGIHYLNDIIQCCGILQSLSTPAVGKLSNHSDCLLILINMVLEYKLQWHSDYHKRLQSMVLGDHWNHVILAKIVFDFRLGAIVFMAIMIVIVQMAGILLKMCFNKMVVIDSIRLYYWNEPWWNKHDLVQCCSKGFHAWTCFSQKQLCSFDLLWRHGGYLTVTASLCVCRDKSS